MNQYYSKEDVELALSLAKDQKPEEYFSPSRQQWHKLLYTCAYLFRRDALHLHMLKQEYKENVDKEQCACDICEPIVCITCSEEYERLAEEKPR